MIIKTILSIFSIIFSLIMIYITQINYKKKYLNSHITIVCSLVNYKLIKQYDLVDKIYVYKKKSSFREKLLLLKKIAKKHYFASFSLDGKTYSNIVNIFIRSKYKLGVSYRFNLFFKNFFWSKPNFFF